MIQSYGYVGPQARVENLTLQYFLSAFSMPSLQSEITGKISTVFECLSKDPVFFCFISTFCNSTNSQEYLMHGSSRGIRRRSRLFGNKSQAVKLCVHLFGFAVVVASLPSKLLRNGFKWRLLF